MNSQFKLNLINHLANKKANKGFTLIELLVVVIIIGVLAAIALPNLLGQVGKARESEAKSQVGAVNRAQQSYYTEYSQFAIDEANLEVPTGTPKYYKFTMGAKLGDDLAAGSGNTPANGNAGSILAENREDVANGYPGKGNKKDGTRDYVGGTSYNSSTRNFATAVCRANNAQKPDFILTFADINDTGIRTLNATSSVNCGTKTVTTK